jgi:threonine/homoserine/homoserine lactone efflux protein
LLPVSIAQLIAFGALDMLLIVTPGADWAYAIAVGVRRGPVAPAVGGLLTGYVLHATVVVVGVGAVLAGNADALRILTLAGSLYLLWLGTTVLRDPSMPTDPGAQTTSAWPTASRGAAVSGLNPKGLLLFFAVLPQFVARNVPWPASAQLVAFATLHIAGCAIVYTAVASRHETSCPHVPARPAEPFARAAPPWSPSASRYSPKQHSADPIATPRRDLGHRSPAARRAEAQPSRRHDRTRSVRAHRSLHTTERDVKLVPQPAGPDGAADRLSAYVAARGPRRFVIRPTPRSPGGQSLLPSTAAVR